MKTGDTMRLFCKRCLLKARHYHKYYCWCKWHAKKYFIIFKRSSKNSLNYKYSSLNYEIPLMQVARCSLKNGCAFLDIYMNKCLPKYIYVHSESLRLADLLFLCYTFQKNVTYETLGEFFEVWYFFSFVLFLVFFFF